MVKIFSPVGATIFDLTSLKVRKKRTDLGYIKRIGDVCIPRTPSLLVSLSQNHYQRYSHAKNHKEPYQKVSNWSTETGEFSL